MDDNRDPHDRHFRALKQHAQAVDHHLGGVRRSGELFVDARLARTIVVEREVGEGAADTTPARY
tara:strand:+ start:355 stop:546 length:192 start_codon:yes stop_codon:yes gene_type:complete